MTSRKNKPVFIALEGGEGAGKSTQAQLLVTRLQQEGRHAILVHEPGTTPLGQHLREYLKSKQKISPEAELLLFEASRAQLMAEVIQPSLSHGISVIADRFAASSIAYQGYGRRIGGKKVRQFNDFATGGLYPDLNILLNLPPSAGLERTSGPQLTLGIRTAGGHPAGHRGHPEVRGPAGGLPPASQRGIPGPGCRRPGAMDNDRRDHAAGPNTRSNLGEDLEDDEMKSSA